jgi:hypothetical protein
MNSAARERVNGLLFELNKNRTADRRRTFYGLGGDDKNGRILLGRREVASGPIAKLLAWAEAEWRKTR